MAVTYHRLLDLQGSIFGHLQPATYQTSNRSAARLPKKQGRLRVNVHKDDFDDRLIRLILRDYFTQAGMNRS